MESHAIEATYFTVGIMFCCGFSSRKRYHRHLPYTSLIFFNRICSAEIERKIVINRTDKKQNGKHPRFMLELVQGQSED